MVPSISISISRPKAAGYKPLSPYTDDEHALSNNLLCPRYAEQDPTSAPPSPASIESFDVLDSVAWRRGYTWFDTGLGKERACGILQKRWQKNKAHMIAILLLLTLFITGCTVGGYLAVKHEQGKFKDDCYARRGGDRCEDNAWARCVVSNGLGYCEGVM